MPLVLLTALAMIAFATNSVFNRAALIDGSNSALDFATLRLLAGAMTLYVLARLTNRNLYFRGRVRWLGVASLLLYIYGFSLAYNSLDAGLGALVLFACVQLTMFIGGLVQGERISMLSSVGTGVALAGLVWLLWPQGEQAISLSHAGLMTLAGIGWGLYSLAGKVSGDALASTAANFIMAAPLGLGFGLVFSSPLQGVQLNSHGVILALVSGAITSGLGYALWYSLLPRMKAASAGVVQLTVPVIAIAVGILVLSEPLSFKLFASSVLVLGGVGLALTAKSKAKP